jgi:hypothetical protein
MAKLYPFPKHSKLCLKISKYFLTTFINHIKINDLIFFKVLGEEKFLIPFGKIILLERI